MEDHVLLPVEANAMEALAAIELIHEIQPVIIPAKAPNRRKKRATPPAVEGIPGLIVDGVDPAAVGQVPAEVTLSKAATRMRQYRADKKSDPVWLNKEAERMRKMRAIKRGLPVEPVVLEVVVDEFGNEVPQPIVDKKNSARKRRVTRAPTVASEESSSGIVRDADVVALDPNGENAAALLVDRFKKRDEFRKREADRIRRYRALKRQDQNWKSKDAERMRTYRRKKRGGDPNIVISQDALAYGMQPDALPAAESGTGNGLVIGSGLGTQESTETGLVGGFGTSTSSSTSSSAVVNGIESESIIITPVNGTVNGTVSGGEEVVSAVSVMKDDVVTQEVFFDSQTQVQVQESAVEEDGSESDDGVKMKVV